MTKKKPEDLINLWLPPPPSNEWMEVVCGGERKAYLSIRPPNRGGIFAPQGETPDECLKRIEWEKQHVYAMANLWERGKIDPWTVLEQDIPVPYFFDYVQLWRLVAVYCGCGKPGEDPWGEQEAFEKWLTNELTKLKGIPEVLRYWFEEQLIWAINETQGRKYFSVFIHRSSDIQKWMHESITSRMSPEYLLFHDAMSAEYWLYMNEVSGCEPQYPKEPLSVEYMIAYIIMKNGVFSPFQLYYTAISSLWIRTYVGIEMSHRMENHPEAKAFVSQYIPSVDEYLPLIIKRFCYPEPYTIPTVDEGLESMIDALGEPLNDQAKRFGEIGRVKSEADHSRVYESIYKRLQEDKEEIVGSENYDFEPTRLEKDIDAAINGELTRALMRPVKNDFKDYCKSLEAQQRQLDEEALSLDMDMGTDPDNPIAFHSYLEMSDTSEESIKRQETIDILIKNANLTKKPSFVVDLRLKGFSYEEIATEFATEFGETTNEAGIRKHWERAKKKIVEGYSQLSTDESEDLPHLQR